MLQNLTFMVEPWESIRAEVQQVLEHHFEALGQDNERMPLLPDDAKYGDFARRGMLVIVVARAAGRLVGYHATFLMPHPHYASTLCGFEDIFWLEPEFRKGFAGVQLIRKAIAEMKRRGVKKTYHQSNLRFPTDKIFQFLGFEQTHVTWAKWIGE